MRRFFATLDAALSAIGRWLIQPLGTRIAVVSLLSIHAGLLAYSATRHSPTHLEPAFLASGISHWQFGRFELYRVNPPLPRMIAALPVLLAGCKTDWTRFSAEAGSRAEFLVAEDFIKANGRRSISLFFYARWACIPFSLVGGYFAFRWATELYGLNAGLLSLTLWTFEPNLLAHAELATPDCACWSLGVLAGYTFWRWLKQPSWKQAGLAGLTLGLAELTKLTWLILFVLWPALWLYWRCLSLVRATPARAGEGLEPKRGGGGAAPCPPLQQLIVVLALGLYVVNIGYAFDGVGVPLKSLAFVSKSMTGLDEGGGPGNRFRESVLGDFPILVPKQYLLGLDVQKKDFEGWESAAYLHGEWKDGGWWYYYVYGLAVKVPGGLLVLLLCLFVVRLRWRPRTVRLQDELVLLSPAVAIVVLCSLHSEINYHLRYAFPALALMLIWCGQFLYEAPVSHVRSLTSAGLSPQARWPARVLVISCVFWLSASSLVAYPHQLAYFNEFAGGCKNGWKHLLGSSFDWGQDVLLANEWIVAHSIPASEVHIQAPGAAVKWIGVPFSFAETPQPNGWELVSTTVLLRPGSDRHKADSLLKRCCPTMTMSVIRNGELQ